MLEIVQKAEPIGANEWAKVASLYETWSIDNYRPIRDATSLKAKFDKLANVKNPTGNPSCPPHVRSTKNIARNILSRASVCVAGEDDDSDKGSDDEIVGDESRKRKRNRVGVSPKNDHVLRKAQRSKKIMNKSL